MHVRVVTTQNRQAKVCRRDWCIWLGRRQRHAQQMKLLGTYSQLYRAYTVHTHSYARTHYGTACECVAGENIQIWNLLNINSIFFATTCNPLPLPIYATIHRYKLEHWLRIFSMRQNVNFLRRWTHDELKSNFNSISTLIAMQLWALHGKRYWYLVHILNLNWDWRMADGNLSLTQHLLAKFTRISTQWCLEKENAMSNALIQFH